MLKVRLLEALAKIPQWLFTTLSAFFVAAGVIVSTIGKNLTGPAYYIAVISSGILAGIGIVLQRVQQKQEQRQSRFNIKLEISPTTPKIPRYTDSGNLIKSWLESEQEICLSSLKSRTKGGFVDLDNPERTRRFGDADPQNSPTSREIIALEKRQKSGETLSKEEQEALTKAHAAFSGMLRASAGFSIFQEFEDRTEDAYRNEVSKYIKSLAIYAKDWLLWSYAKSGYGRIEVTIVNSTDKTLNEVELKLGLHEKTAVYDGRTIANPRTQRPERPAAFGQRSARLEIPSLLTQGLLVPPRARSTTQEAGLLRPISISTNQATEVTFSPVTIRPHSAVKLEAIHVLADQPSGTTISVTWTASATNADGRQSGVFEISTSNKALPVQEWVISKLELPNKQ
ncbi:hypothetical protein [Kutzneria sp. 744]|uniref:hypothetical protein n=1 Tax=Kutzneria sp. (strain 744) TaxID=345341 RepID=UPI0012FAE33A|nr:hypothetical protein [Kutzneria sp. 744]